MTHIALFHSVYGLRPAVLAAAERFRQDGHEVVAPDLYAGPVASSIDEGFGLSGRIGWDTIVRRAREAVQSLPAHAVLAGISMGTGVVGALLPDRRRTAGLLLVHGVGGGPASVRAGLPVEIHIAEADEMFPYRDVVSWGTTMSNAGADVRLHAYSGMRHYFTDPDAPDYDETAADLVWQRSLTFLGSV